MTKVSSPTLATTRTGGISFSQVFLLLAALGCIGIQVVLLLQTPQENSGGPVARFLPGILGGLILLLGLLAWGRKGSSSLTRHHISGKTSAGKTYEFALATLAPPDLQRGAFILRDASSGKVVLQDRLPEDPHYLGTIWLAQTYTELPNTVWQAFAEAKGPQVTSAVRSFIDHQGRTAFLDAGIVVAYEGWPCYFPTSTTQPFIQPKAGQDALSTNVRSQPMQLRFEPNPARLPMERFLRALTSVTPASEALRDTLLDSHGGCRLQAQENGWTGECAGYPVEVSAGN